MTTNKKLLIDDYTKEILALIDSNLVTQINAATGSGKSIGVTKALAEDGHKVFVSVPTRVSATSLSSYLHYLSPKLSVGYAADGNSEYDYDTQVVYATSGHVRRKLFGYFSRGDLRSRNGLNFTDILILDETHSGSMDNTVIMSLWMYAHKKGIPVPKLVLMSATPSDLPIKPDPAVFNVPVPTPFDVEIIYDAPDADADIYEHAAAIAISKHHSGLLTGDILIFVPGSREAEELVSFIKDEADDALVLPAYSTLEADQLKMIYTPSPNGERKIIVATNIAESSITLDGLAIVIDTMQCKEATASTSGAIKLETVQITKSSAKQRLGRTGRTCSGICYRLISESDYELLEEFRKPEIERMPLHNVVMEFLKAGINPIDSIAGIDTNSVLESIELLIRLRLLEKVEDETVVTDCGNFAPTVPLGVRNAAFLWRWIQETGSIYEGIVISAIIDVHSTGYFYIPRKKREMAPGDYIAFCNQYIDEKFKQWIGETPMHTYLNAWHSFTNSLGRNHFRLINEPGSIKFNRWTRDHSVNHRQFSELISIIAQTYRVVRKAIRRVNVNVYVFDTNLTLNTATPIFHDIYEDNAMSPSWLGEMYHPKTMTKHVFDNRRVISAIECGNSRIIPLATHEIVTRAGLTMGYVDLCLPFPLDTTNSELDSESKSEHILKSESNPKKEFSSNYESESVPEFKPCHSHDQKSQYVRNGADSQNQETMDSDRYRTRNQETSDSDRYRTQNQETSDSDRYRTQNQETSDSDRYRTRNQETSDSDRYRTQNRDTRDSRRFRPQNQDTRDSHRYRPQNLEDVGSNRGGSGLTDSGRYSSQNGGTVNSDRCRPEAGGNGRYRSQNRETDTYRTETNRYRQENRDNDTYRPDNRKIYRYRSNNRDTDIYRPQDRDQSQRRSNTQYQRGCTAQYQMGRSKDSI